MPHPDKSSAQIPAENVSLAGDLVLPQDLRGFVLFAHGSGSSRHSPRNQYVAGVLNTAGIGTLLLDLLTEEEEALDRQTAHLRFDIPLLAMRIRHAAVWLLQQPQISSTRLGLFGASTGAAAALLAASQTTKDLHAIVSRGGRPDLAGRTLSMIKAPVLLIVGEKDRLVLDLNRDALSRLNSEKKLEVIPGATHLFEEPGTLEEVARLARQWFEQHLRSRHSETHAA